MNISEVKELIQAVSDSDLTAFDYKEGNIMISLRKAGSESVSLVSVSEPGKSADITQRVETTELKSSGNEEKNQDEKDTSLSGNIVKSPLVGTAYMAAEEGGEPFVKVGDIVKKGQILAIVEAMKLMNEIESDFDGVVKEILVENGQTVEYGQEMFVIG